MKRTIRVERMTGIVLDGVAVKRLVGMIYWYGWGNMEFDIRIVREILHLPKTHPADHWFNSETPDSTGSFERIVTQLKKALQSSGLRFYDVLMLHDAKIFDESLLAEVKEVTHHPAALA